MQDVGFLSPANLLDACRAVARSGATLEWLDAVGYNADITGNAREFGIAPTRFVDWAARVDWS